MQKVLAILRSVRFWQLVAGAVTIYLGETSVLDQEKVTLLSTVFFGSAGIGTVDRAFDRLGGK